MPRGINHCGSGSRKTRRHISKKLVQDMKAQNRENFTIFLCFHQSMIIFANMMTTTIEINRLRLRARHGVMQQERTVGNIFEVTAHLQCNVGRAIADDDLSATLNYAEAIDIIKSEMAIPSRLLEHAAGRIRTALTIKFPCITGGRITIAKLTPPIPVEVKSVAVTIQW